MIDVIQRLADLAMPVKDVRKLYIDYADQVLLDETTDGVLSFDPKAFTRDVPGFREHLRQRLYKAFEDRRFNSAFKRRREVDKLVARLGVEYKAKLREHGRRSRKATRSRGKRIKREQRWMPSKG